MTDIDIRSSIRPEPADDRGTCGTCRRLDLAGVCTAAGPKGPVIAQRGYKPSGLFRETLHRCAGFVRVGEGRKAA